MVVLPGRHEAGSLSEVGVQVGEGGSVDVRCEPTIVAARASHSALSQLDLDEGARADLTEHVLLGRYGELPGHWRGRTSAVVAGRPVLRHTLRSDVLLRDGHRAAVTRVRLGHPDDVVRVLSDVHAVRLPLCGRGTLLTATGVTLPDAVANTLRLGSTPS
jgi:urease accessory protein